MQEIEIDFFRREDAPGVARLFRQVYGDGYPVDIYYKPERLIEENAARRIISTVVRTKDGEVVGHDALIILDPDARLYENAAGLILPAFRGKGTFFRLMSHTIRDTAKQFGLTEIIGEPVCNHTQLQKMCAQLDYKETGLEVDLMPAAAYTTEQSARGRVSVMLGYFLHKPVKRAVYMPAVYRNEMEFLYSGLGFERTFAEPAANLPADGNSEGKMDIYDFAQVARIVVHRIGSDFDVFISRLESEARKRGVMVFQIWLPLTSPFVASAADALRRHGFFIGGLLPNRFSEGDGLLMQKAMHETDWEGMALYTERARRIAAIVRTDSRRAAKQI
jgi:GNAT superfamily N-acetyltransferase